MWVGPLGVGRLFAWIHFFFNPTKIKMKIISKEQHKFSNHVHLFTCRQTHQVYWLLFFNKNSMFIVHWYSSPNRNSWIKAAAVLWLFSKYMVHYLYSCMSPVVSRQVLFSVSLFSFSFFSFKGFNLEPSCAIFMPYSLDRPTPLWAVLRKLDLNWRGDWVTLLWHWDDSWKHQKIMEAVAEKIDWLKRNVWICSQLLELEAGKETDFKLTFWYSSWFAFSCARHFMFIHTE